jgi:hypothetical protein
MLGMIVFTYNSNGLGHMIRSSVINSKTLSLKPHMPHMHTHTCQRVCAHAHKQLFLICNGNSIMIK